MAQKIRFTVENAEMLNENPESNFAVLSLDFFASGDNLHNLYVSEETLMRTADTIKNCPLVWKYDEELDDVYTHDKDEVPCGFVPETATVESKRLPDGRTMLSVIAYVWKRYTGELLNIFKRDGGRKPVSVEMSVFGTKPLQNGKNELTDFRYEGITVLGSFVTPAIPMAKASVLSFAQMKKEYLQDVEKEFPFPEIDLSIPEVVRDTAQEGLRLAKQQGGATSVGISAAKYLTTKESLTPEKVEAMVAYFSKHQDNDPERNIDWLLWGGDSAWKWSEKLYSQIKGRLVTFPYKSVSEINPALKGIDPPISLSQANAIARQADSIGSDEKKNGWAIAISSFKKTHKVVNGKWVKKNSEEMSENYGDLPEALGKAEGDQEKSQKEEMSMDEKEKEVLMAEDTAESEKKETPAQEKAETPAEEKKEQEKGIEKKFEFPANFDSKVVSNWFAEEEEEMCKMANEEIAKGEFADPAIVMGGMYAKMCRMAEAMVKMAEDQKVYMAENEELKKFKADVEKSQKEFAVEQVIKELAEKVVIPEETKAEMLAEAEKYSFADLEGWKTYCKAKSFDFAVRENGKTEAVKVGLPFTAGTKKRNDDLWS